jgi:hypothetical protein
MENYLIENIQKFETINSDKTYLILFHVDKQPPHLGVVVNGAYFSLRYDKLQMGIDPESIMKTVRTKKIKTLIFEIDEKGSNVESIFEKYSSIDSISCLFPLREFFFPNGFESIQLIFDLLDKLKSDSKIIKTYSLNLEPDTTTFNMKRYSIQDVQNEIKRLKK